MRELLWRSFVRSQKATMVSVSFIFLFILINTSASAQTPTITGFTPTTICQGGVVTITGTNFDDITSVKLGSTDAASFNRVSSTAITATVSDFATTGTVQVTTKHGTANPETATATGNLTINPTPRPGLNHVGALDPFTNCNGNAIYTMTVSNISVTQNSNNKYEINWGDNTPVFTATDWGSGAQTTHTYTAQGYFTITITITPANGCTRSVTYRFYNGQNPLGSFTTTASTTGLCAPAAIEFQVGNWFNNSAGTTYELDWGDKSPKVTLTHPLNNSNTVEKVSHLYTTTSCPQAADFTATLKASNGCFVTTYTLNQIIIRKKPTANFTTQSALCVTDAVCFNNTSVDGYSGNNCNSVTDYVWDFGDGTSTSTQKAPCHKYAAPGTYTVILKASSAACGEDKIEKQVTVLPISQAPVATSPINYCVGQQSAALTATGTNLLWYTVPTGGSGTATAPIPSTATAGTRTWYVSQTVTGSCESTRVPITVTVYALPAAPTVTSPVLYCQNQTATPLTANGSNLQWYTTATGGGGTSTAPTPLTNTLGTVTYFVSQTTNGCESLRSPITVTVNSIAGAPQVVSPVTYCQNTPASPLTATGTSLLWYTGATGGTGTSAAPVPSTATAGSTTYYVSQVTGCGESPRAAIVVNVNASATAAIAYTPSILCNVTNIPQTPNPPVTVTHTGAPGGTYTITPATGLPIDATTGTLIPAGATAGTYTIRYTIPGTGGCPNFVATTTVTVNSTPNARITYPVMCTSSGVTNVALTGTAGGTYTAPAGLSINASTGAITPFTSTAGTYTVTYTIPAAGPCPGLITTTTATIAQAPSVTIAYNPATLCNVINSTNTPNPPVTVTHTGSTGGTYSITPSTGLNMDLATGTLNPSGATPGTYTISYIIPGTTSCPVYNTTTTVTVNGAPAASISYPGSPYCGGLSTPQAVTFTGTTGGTYTAGTGLIINATTGAITPATSTPGTYTVTYTIAAAAPCPGLTITTPVTISESPKLTFASPNQEICSGKTATYIPSSTVPNTTYAWALVGTLPAGVAGLTSGTASGANPTISLSYTNTGTASQLLTIRVTPTNPSQNPCQGASYDITLRVDPIPPAPLTDTTHFCMHGTSAALVVTPLPGNTIKWYDQNGQLMSAAPVVSTTVPAKFIYYVTQTSVAGCESPKAEKVAVVHPIAKVVTTQYNHPVACGVPSGSIVLNVLDLNNNPIPNIPVIIHYSKFQIALTMLLSTDGTGKITIPLTAGTYSDIYVETSGSCTSQKIPDVFILKDPNPPAAPVVGYNPPLCSENPLILTALTPTSTQNGPIDYVWAGPAFGPYADTIKNSVVTFPSASMQDAGTYVVYATQNNCISLPASMTVAIKQSPSKPIINTRLPLCIGDELFLQAFSAMPGNTALTYLWKGPGAGFPVTTPNAGIPKVKVSDSGIYSITATSTQTGCSVTTDTLIQIGDYPIVKFGRDTLTFPTGYRYPMNPVITNAAEPGVMPMKNYAWTPSADLECNDAICPAPIATIKTNGCYTVKATNIYGCSGSDTICFKVFCQNSQVFVPNAFAPRGNVAENTKLMVRATGIAAVKSFRVFNRWGKIVFEKNNFAPNNPAYGWDGMVNGKLADTGVYIYTVDVICENGVPYTYKGNVTLL